MPIHYHEIYNKAYAKLTPEWLLNQSQVEAYLERNRHTLAEFFEDYCSQFNFPGRPYAELRILDLGCGLGGMSFYFAEKGAKVVGVDVSSLALTSAKELARQKGLEVNFVCLDLSLPQDALGKFDLVFDSHLLHCLTNEEHRKNYFEFVQKNLAPNGLFLLETMVFQKYLRTPVGYSMDENFVLWKESKEGEEHPYRKIQPGIDLEKQVKAFLNINYLYFHAELSFEVFSEYEGYPHQNLPQTARLAGRLRKS